MKKQRHERIIINRAEVGFASPVDCENCFEPLLSGMRDSRGNEFSVGLNTLLQCLIFAEEQGALPPFPKETWDWWLAVKNRYNLPHQYYTE